MSQMAQAVHMTSRIPMNNASFIPQILSLEMPGWKADDY
jgi:hypothetical protein